MTAEQIGYLCGQLCGAFFVTLIISRLFLFRVLKTQRNDWKKVLVAHIASLGFCIFLMSLALTGQVTRADPGVVIFYTIPQMIWFCIDLYRLKKNRLFKA